MSMKTKFPLLFIFLALLALMLGAFWGALASVVYLDPQFLKDIIPFNKLRPLHVTTVVSWIILAASGGIYYYVDSEIGLKYKQLGKIHLIIFLLTGLAIYLSIFTGNTGGKEYLAYLPILSVPILLGWIFFCFNYFKTMLEKVQNWPVYYWMWGTGLAFMIYHFSEAHLWIIPHFRENFIRDITVQWKSYGAFVGSWNMLVYGTAVFLMARMQKDESVGRGKMAFFFYFLGLTNLMFGWAHHTYIIPTQPWIRYVAYGISMTEWVVLAHIIHSWKKTITAENKQASALSYRFLIAADWWVLTNLFLALLISIPFINLFTHGTAVTIAHSMGTTVGINTCILFSSVILILGKAAPHLKIQQNKLINTGYLILQISLTIFLLSLMASGVEKSFWMYFVDGTTFAEIQSNLSIYYIIFALSGFGLLVGLVTCAAPLSKKYWAVIRSS